MNKIKILGRRLKWTIATSPMATIMVGSGCAAKQEETAVGRYDKVPGGAYAVVAEIRAKPGMENELRAATLPLITEVRREPNNLLYSLHEGRETPGHFVFYEIFATQADFEAHNKTPHVRLGLQSSRSWRTAA